MITHTIKKILMKYTTVVEERRKDCIWQDEGGGGQEKEGPYIRACGSGFI